jgi:hypothetical protein
MNTLSIQRRLPSMLIARPRALSRSVKSESVNCALVGIEDLQRSESRQRLLERQRTRRRFRGSWRSAKAGRSESVGIVSSTFRKSMHA